MMKICSPSLKYITITAFVFGATGCSLFASDNAAHSTTMQNVNVKNMRQSMVPSVQEQTELYADATQFVPAKHHKTLVNYVEQMALDLTDTMQNEDEKSIAVTTFVKFDGTLNSSTQLGNQIAETFIHQMQKFGYGIVDFKTADFIQVNSRGDFVFSRDIEELAETKVAAQILSGTLIYRPNGVEINARIVDIASKRVLASSQKVLPYFVLTNNDINIAQTTIN